jgi:hypothetical protein
MKKNIDGSSFEEAGFSLSDRRGKPPEGDAHV